MKFTFFKTKVKQFFQSVNANAWMFWGVPGDVFLQCPKKCFSEVPREACQGFLKEKCNELNIPFIDLHDYAGIGNSLITLTFQ